MQNENSIDIRRFAENERFARERAESTADSFNDAKVSSQAEVFFETEAEIELSTKYKTKTSFLPSLFFSFKHFSSFLPSSILLVFRRISSQILQHLPRMLL